MGSWTAPRVKYSLFIVPSKVVEGLGAIVAFLDSEPYLQITLLVVKWFPPEASTEITFFSYERSLKPIPTNKEYFLSSW